MRVSGPAGLRVGLEVGPGPVVFRHLDPVARDRAGPGIGRRAPFEIDCRLSVGRGLEVGGGAGGRPASSGRVGDVGRPAGLIGIDGGDPVVAGRPGREPRVFVGEVGVSCVGHPVAPGRAAVARHLDPVAGDLAAPGVDRHRPGQIDGRFAAGRGAEVAGGGGGRPAFGGRPGDVGRVARPAGIDGGDPVVAGIPGREPRMLVGEVGFSCVGHPVAPGRAVGRHLDLVARDLAVSGVGRFRPGQIDGRFAVRRGAEVAGGAGRPGHGSGGRVGDVGRPAGPIGVDGGDPVVAGRIGSEIAVSVGEVGVSCVAIQGGKARAAAARHLDLVARDLAAAGIGRCRPGQIDGRVSAGRCAEVAGGGGGRASGGRVGDVGRPAGPIGIDGGDPVVAGRLGSEIAVSVGEVGVSCVAIQGGKARAAAARHLDLVAGDLAAPGVDRHRPGQIDGRVSAGRGAEVAGGGGGRASGGRVGDVGRPAGPIGVDGFDPVVAGRIGSEIAVCVGEVGVSCVAIQGGKARAAVARHLDLVARDLAAAGIGRFRPGQIDGRGSAGRGAEVAGGTGGKAFGGRPGDVGRVARPMGIDGGDPVVAGIPGREPRMLVGEVGFSCVVHTGGPGRAVGRHLDLVARDLAVSGVGRFRPGQIDGRFAVRRGAEVAGGAE